jgi:hypothetical protein
MIAAGFVPAPLAPTPAAAAAAATRSPGFNMALAASSPFRSPLAAAATGPAAWSHAGRCREYMVDVEPVGAVGSKTHIALTTTPLPRRETQQDSCPHPWAWRPSWRSCTPPHLAHACSGPPPRPTGPSRCPCPRRCPCRPCPPPPDADAAIAGVRLASLSLEESALAPAADKTASPGTPPAALMDAAVPACASPSACATTYAAAAATASEGGGDRLASAAQQVAAFAAGAAEDQVQRFPQLSMLSEQDVLVASHHMGLPMGVVANGVEGRLCVVTAQAVPPAGDKGSQSGTVTTQSTTLLTKQAATMGVVAAKQRAPAVAKALGTEMDHRLFARPLDVEAGERHDKVYGISLAIPSCFAGVHVYTGLKVGGVVATGSTDLQLKVGVCMGLA